MFTTLFNRLPRFPRLTNASTDLAAPAAAQPLLRSRRGTSRAALALVLFAAVPAGAGCGAADLTPQITLIDHTTAPLSLGALNAINGTYGSSCIGRSGSWSSPIGGFAGTMDNDPLSVVKGNSTCSLTLTSVLIGSLKYDPASTVTLTGSYAGTAVAYSQEMMSAVAFYGNLKLSDASFTSSFSISLMFSDDSALASAGSAQSTYKYNSITSTQSNVVPTDYTVDGSSVGVQTDANKSISDVAGHIDLTDGIVTGQNYVISSVDLSSAHSFDDIDAAYTAGTPVTISGPNPFINASALGLVGVSLASGDITREIIVAHIVNNIRAYQVITLTVLAP